MLIDTKTNKRFEKKNISEDKLRNIITNNFDIIFPEFRLVDAEHRINGDVRQFGISGRIDILAFNPLKHELVIFELKKKHSKNILFQAYDYVDFIDENFEAVVSKLKELTGKEKKLLIDRKEQPKVILIAKKFLHPTIRRVKRLENNITLYEYDFYANDSFRLNKLKTNENISTKIKNIPENNFHNNNIFSIVKEILENQNIDNKYYKLESNKLIINPTKLFESYQEYFEKTEIIPLSKMDFFKSLRASEEFITYKKSTRFNNKSTSAMIFKM